MSDKTIVVVKDFHPAPKGRYPSEGDFSGQRFRDEILAPAMNRNDHVHVVLDGYNRYGRSFIDEAFGGLVRENGFTEQQLKTKLTYSHSLIKSLERLIAERIDAAIKDCSTL